MMRCSLVRAGCGKVFMSKTHVEKFEFEDGLTRLKTSIESLVRAEPALLDNIWLKDCKWVGIWWSMPCPHRVGYGILERYCFGRMGSGRFVDPSRFDRSYQDATGVIRAEYSAKSGESPPAAQSRGLGTYHLTIPQCRQFYRHGVQAWLDQNPMLYPHAINTDTRLWSMVILFREWWIWKIIIRQMRVDLEHVPPHFMHRMKSGMPLKPSDVRCFIAAMSLSVDGICICIVWWRGYLALVQTVEPYCIFYNRFAAGIASELLQACVRIRTAASNGGLAGEIRRKTNTATWTICDDRGRAVIGIMREMHLVEDRNRTGKAHSIQSASRFRWRGWTVRWNDCSIYKIWMRAYGIENPIDREIDGIEKISAIDEHGSKDSSLRMQIWLSAIHSFMQETRSMIQLVRRAKRQFLVFWDWSKYRSPSYLVRSLAPICLLH